MASKVLATAAGVIVAASLGLAGCGTDNTANNTSSASTNQTKTTAAKTTKADKNTAVKSSANPSATVSVTLNPSKDSKVKGTATLTLDQKTHELTVVVKASGFAPNSVHPEHISTGTTAKPGAEVYALANLTADKKGDATSTTVIKGVKNIPASDWVILVQEGSKDVAVVASGDVKTTTK